MTVQRHFGWYNVIDDHDILAAGGDLGLALNRILARIPDQRNAGDSGFEGHGTNRVVIPSNYPGAAGLEYPIRTQVEIRPDLNVEIVGDGIHGVGLDNQTGLDWSFTFGDTSGVGAIFSIKNLTMKGGGLDISARRRGVTNIEGMKFMHCPAPAILLANDPVGLGPVTVRVHGMTQFYGCAGGIWDEASTYLLHYFDHLRFIASTDIPIKLDGPGIRMSEADFQSVAPGVETFIQMPGQTDGNSQQTIRECRFGQEGGIYPGIGTLGAPGCDILMGDLSPAVDPPENMGNIDLIGNHHMGGDKDYAIRLTAQPLALKIDHSFFGASHLTAIISEEWVGGTAAFVSDATNAERLLRNRWGLLNTVQDTGDVTPADVGTGTPAVKTRPIFEKGGVGWEAPNLWNSYSDGQRTSYERKVADNGNIYATSISNTGVPIIAQVITP